MYMQSETSVHKKIPNKNIKLLIRRPRRDEIFEHLQLLSFSEIRLKKRFELVLPPACLQ